MAPSRSQVDAGGKSIIKTILKMHVQVGNELRSEQMKIGLRHSKCDTFIKQSKKNWFSSRRRSWKINSEPCFYVKPAAICRTGLSVTNDKEIMKT